MQRRKKKFLFLSLDIILFLLIFLLVFYLVFERVFDNKILPNVYLGDLNLAGLEQKQAEKLIKEEIEKLEDQGIAIELLDKKIIWHNAVFSFDPDLNSQTVIFNPELSAQQAYLAGRDGFCLGFFSKMKTLFFRTKVDLSFYLNQEGLTSVLRESFSDFEITRKDAQLKLENLNSEEDFKFIIEEERSGYQIDLNKFFIDFKKNLSNLDRDAIRLRLITKEPLIKKIDTGGLEWEAKKLIDDLGLTIKSGDYLFSVEKINLANWLGLSLFSNNENNKTEIVFSFSSDKVKSFLKENIAPQVEQDLVLPAFEFEGDRVSFFEAGKDGVKINYDLSFLEINKIISQPEIKEVELVLELEISADLGDFNNLGIKELVGSGNSNFAGSSANRRHNIRVGASKLHGLIIKPGEEFSLNRALGKVDKENGYLPELVIKGNKTVPEYGGGLCQIATTMFRAALGSGLPITERRNHSYRVSYYEPAGTDATIYSPHPDLRFLNDTADNILIQARFEEPNDIYFDFWGTSDQRLVSSTSPVIYNIVKPGPTQLIESPDLAPGEKRCTESAHYGAETYFDYFVTYNPGKEDEKKVENRFYSKYVPWREVCLIGVNPNKNDNEDKENKIGDNNKDNNQTEKKLED